MRQPRKPKGSPGGAGGQYDTIKGGGAGGLPAMGGPTVRDVEQALAPLVERARVEERDGVIHIDLNHAGLVRPEPDPGTGRMPDGYDPKRTLWVPSRLADLDAPVGSVRRRRAEETLRWSGLTRPQAERLGDGHFTQVSEYAGSYSLDPDVADALERLGGRIEVDDRERTGALAAGNVKVTAPMKDDPRRGVVYADGSRGAWHPMPGRSVSDFKTGDSAMSLLDRDTGREIGRLVSHDGVRRLVPGRDVIRFHEQSPYEPD